MDPSKGYQTAKKLLKERFGYPYVMLPSVLTIKPSDRIGLLNFADELTDCQNILQSIG